MGVIDWVILAVLLLFAFQGFRRGLAAAAINICGAIATFFLIAQFFPLVRNALAKNLGVSGLLSTIFAVILIAILMAVIIRLLIFLTNRVIKAIRLGFVNKLLGTGLGLVHGLLIVIVVMVALDYFPKLTKPLKDGEKHRVYAAADVIKEEAFNIFKLTQREEYHKIVKAAKEARDKAAEHAIPKQ